MIVHLHQADTILNQSEINAVISVLKEANTKLIAILLPGQFNEKTIFTVKIDENRVNIVSSDFFKKIMPVIDPSNIKDTIKIEIVKKKFTTFGEIYCLTIDIWHRNNEMNFYATFNTIDELTNAIKKNFRVI